MIGKKIRKFKNTVLYDIKRHIEMHLHDNKLWESACSGTWGGVHRKCRLYGQSLFLKLGGTAYSHYITVYTFHGNILQ